MIHVTKVNPSGITLNTFTITYNHGILSHLETADQWGKITEHRKYEMVSENLFRLTEFKNGVNVYLPCKYALQTFKNDLLIESSFHTSSGRLKNIELGFAIIRVKRYDDNIRFAERMEVSYFDENNMPVISKENGIHKIKLEYDLSDNKISESYLDISDKPAADKATNMHGFRAYYDQDNHMIKQEFLGSNGQVSANANGVAGARLNFENGYMVKLVRTDSLNRIIRASSIGDGIAIINLEYDSNGNQIKRITSDETGKPIKDQEGVSMTVKKYSANNMLTSLEYFDEFGKPVINRGEIHQYVYINDSLGRTIQVSFFNNEGKPTKDYTNEVYMIKSKYDSNGLETSESYWKDRDTAMPRWSGTYEVRRHYNDDGQIIEYDYYDKDGFLMKTDEGYSVCRILRDQDGIMYARQYLYHDELINKKTGISYGFSIIRYEYDSVGKITQILFYGNQHEAINATIDITNPIKVNRIQFIYKGSRIVEQWYYALNNSEPFLKLDCLKNDFLGPNGISTGHKNAN